MKFYLKMIYTKILIVLPVFYLVIVLENLNAIPNSPLGKVDTYIKTKFTMH